MYLITTRRYHLLLMFLLFMGACGIEKVSVKNPPLNQPFVFDNKVILHNGQFSKSEKKKITAELNGQWDDSMIARRAQRYLLFEEIKNPPVFDTANLRRSQQFMKNYMNGRGFYYANFRDSIKVDTFKQQLRTTVYMHVYPGKNVLIDSVAFDLADSVLAAALLPHQQKTLLKKGAPFSKQIISSELDRLTSVFQQNGFFKISRDDLYAEVDTTDKALLDISLDIFEQAQQLEAAAKRRTESPSWDVSIKNRAINDSTKNIAYKIGKLIYYPESKFTDIVDSLLVDTSFKSWQKDEFEIRYKEGNYNLGPLKEHTFLRKGMLYNERLFFKSLNALNEIGTWGQVDVRPKIRDRDTMDLYFFMSQESKYNYSIDLETSRNTSDIIGGNLVGISSNFNFRNRNVWKSAIQSNTSLRAGVELNVLQSTQLLQTVQMSAGHTFIFPKLIVPFKLGPIKDRMDAKRTLLSTNYAYTDRRNIFRLRSFITSWGYEWKRGNNIWLYKPVSVELYGLDTLPLLSELFNQNPFLRLSFNTGNVISQSISYVKTFQGRTNRNNHYLRFGVEEAGSIMGAFPRLRSLIYRYVKTEAEYRYSFKLPQTEWAFRLFGGAGFNYSDDPTIGSVMPFFKQFAGGGPNSMRAWQLRQLGLGSSIANDTISTTTFRDRLGDMMLEANLEYRFTLLSLGSFNIASVLFADVGNIWNIRKKEDNPNAEFNFRRLYKDLAVSVGTGLRFDFSYFLIRLDAGFKLKDPARPTPNGWADFKNLQFTETRPNGVQVRNFALQLGIGLPF